MTNAVARDTRVVHVTEVYRQDVFWLVYVTQLLKDKIKEPDSRGLHELHIVKEFFKYIYIYRQGSMEYTINTRRKKENLFLKLEKSGIRCSTYR